MHHRRILINIRLILDHDNNCWFRITFVTFIYFGICFLRVRIPYSFTISPPPLIDCWKIWAICFNIRCSNSLFYAILKYFPFVTCKILVGLTVESTEVGAAASSFLSFERQCVFSNSMIRKDEFLNCLKVWSLTSLLIVYLDFCTVYLD